MPLSPPEVARRTPFAHLDPATVLDALHAAGLAADGRLLQLNSYENRVWQAHLDDGRVAVAKFYRPGRWSDAQILEEHAFSAQLQAAEVPVAAPWVLAGTTLHHHAGLRYSVTPRQGGRAPELEDPTVLTWIGRYIARIHTVGRARPFAVRQRWDSAAPGHEALRHLLEHDSLLPELRPAWEDVARRCLDRIDEAFASLPGLGLQRLHGDCHPGNILWTPDRGPHFVDLDDAVTGPAVQDLWMMLSGDSTAMGQQMACVLAGYEELLDFDRRELRLIEPLRTLRMIHYSGWLARRWDDPAFPLAFPWFGTPNYWNDQIVRLREQLEAMREPAPAGWPAPATDDDFHLDGDSFA